METKLTSDERERERDLSKMIMILACADVNLIFYKKIIWHYNVNWCGMKNSCLLFSNFGSVW